MSQFDEMFQPAQDRLFSVFGRAATYNGAEITVLVDADQGRGSYAEVNVPAATMTVRESDVPRPRPGDQVLWDGATWYVGEPITRTGDAWSLVITKQIQSVRV